MYIKCSTPFVISMLLIFVSCNSQEQTVEETKPVIKNEKKERHRYGGWYCPDNFGFVPVDIQKLNEVPVVMGRLPTQQELDDNMSLIKVDTTMFPDARALEMELPRVATIYSERKGMNELIVVIQAIVVQEDTVVGYRFANGGNGSAWLGDVTFLSSEEVAAMGAQPFFYSRAELNASPKNIWSALGKTDYFKDLGKKFDEEEFFTNEWNPKSRTSLNLDAKGENATGFVGMIYGNYYLHIDYDRDGHHYSEKMLIMENQEKNTTELFFASGPYPTDFEKEKSKWSKWFDAVKKSSEEN